MSQFSKLSGNLPRSWETVRIHQLLETARKGTKKSADLQDAPPWKLLPTLKWTILSLLHMISTMHIHLLQWPAHLHSWSQVEVDLEQAGDGTAHSKRNEYMLSPVPVRYVKMECGYSSNKNQNFATHTVQTSHIRDVEDSYAEIPHISASLLLWCPVLKTSLLPNLHLKGTISFHMKNCYCYHETWHE